ncbi:glycolate oxidase subunit GlcE [Variovorax sp. PCZ-1]|uniref:glycolate oxidase subunit GlcE n=1 Tax=Variovorax sp. PCZ-1 TaxID=2835533 RepID=UPI001BD15453|nr:glycolate oxidase subunit GlcE [Variovorax sp. PCZ-1]MBS7809022.1 glycolate oxidase subunit GlcE [Variovorax sp. PCZ-1]
MDASLISLVDQIQAAVSAKAPLRIRGGGSKDFYGEPFDAALPVLDTRAHAGIVSYEPSELVITAKAGTPLAELEAVLSEKGQCLAFEPPHFNESSTVGGMVAAGLAGPARACVGGVRDYVLGAHLVNGKAELLEFGGQVMKNVAGYDVSRALAGSMGTLGLITQVSLKVLPKAVAEATLRFEMDEAAAIRYCNEWAGQPLPLNASSWVMDQGVPSLYLRLRGAVAAVNSACQRLAIEAGGIRVDSPETLADWSAARDLQLPWFKEGFARGDDLWRISVPQITPPMGLGDTMMDWLGGQRWLFTPSAERSQAAQRIRAAVQATGGNTTLFIASRADSMPAISRFDTQNEPLKTIHRKLKTEFDPAGIFNPGRLGVI